MVETLRAARKFSVVVLESLYTWFLSGPPDDFASIHKFGWVEWLFPYLSLNRLLYVSWKLKKKSSYSTQENNNLRNKMVEQTYHEVLSAIVDELLHPPLRSSLRTCISTNNSVGLSSRLRDIACNKKMLQVKYIYK
jgi:hypothetical protein